MRIATVYYSDRYTRSAIEKSKDSKLIHFFVMILFFLSCYSMCRLVSSQVGEIAAGRAGSIARCVLSVSVKGNNRSAAVDGDVASSAHSFRWPASQ